MSTLTQLLLVMVISIMTFFVTVAGIQVFQILYEVRLLLKKINKIADSSQNLSELVLKSQLPEITDTVPDAVIPASRDKTFRRFFHRTGIPLRPS